MINTKPLNLLIVDDDKSIRDGICAIIKDHILWDFLIFEAASGSEAVAVFQTAVIHILITDIKMPQMNGLELITLLKENGISCQILMLSGYDDYTYLRTSLKKGAYDYLLKPINLNMFLEVLEDLKVRTLCTPNEKLLPIMKQSPLYLADTEFFDKSTPFLLDADSRKKALDSAVESMILLNTEAAIAYFQTYFSGITIALEEGAIREELSAAIYSLMQRNSGFIKIVGRNKLTDCDIFNAIKNLPTQSQLEHRFLSLIPIYIKQYIELHCQNDEYYIRQAKEYISANINKDLTLTAVADMLCIHPNYFSTLFKEKVGITFREYTRTIRIQKAQELIKQNYLISDVAVQVGYQDTSHFNRAFKKVTSITPSEYKKREL